MKSILIIALIILFDIMTWIDMREERRRNRERDERFKIAEEMASKGQHMEAMEFLSSTSPLDIG